MSDQSTTPKSEASESPKDGSDLSAASCSSVPVVFLRCEWVSWLTSLSWLVPLVVFLCVTGYYLPEFSFAAGFSCGVLFLYLHVLLWAWASR